MMREGNETENSNKSRKKTKAVFPVLPNNSDEEQTTPFVFSETEDVFLPEDYEPTKYDVINGRGKKSYNHVANRRFRQLTAMNLKRYQSAKCKVDKTLVVIGIVNSIRKSSPLSGGFIKKCPKTGRWVSMSDEAAREKVGHCLRDMIASHRDDNSRQTIKPQKTNNAREPKPYVPNSGNEHIQMNLLANAAGLHGRFQNIPTTLPSLQKNNGNKKAGKQPAAKVKRQAKTRQPGALDATSRIRPPMETSSMPSRSGRDPPSFRPPFSFPGALPSPSFPALQQQMSNRISSSFNNFDAMAVARGCQEMSLQQQRILVLLENGFRGSVEELLEAVKY